MPYLSSTYFHSKIPFLLVNDAFVDWKLRKDSHVLLYLLVEFLFDPYIYVQPSTLGMHVGFDVNEVWWPPGSCTCAW